MNLQAIHTILTVGTTYMILGAGGTLFCLYKLARTGFFRDFFTGKG
jgi:hypothetical protein